MAAVGTDTLVSLLPDWARDQPRILELLDRHKSIGPALQDFGIERYQAGDAALAVSALEAASALHPHEAVYLNNLGVALNETGDAAGAIAVFHRSLEIDPGQAQIWLNLGYTLRAQGQLSEAVEAFERAAAHPDTAKEAAAALGVTALERGRNTEAADTLRHAVEDDPGNATLHASYGAALFQICRPTEAAEAYNIAAQLNPNEPGFRTNADFLTMLSGIMTGGTEAAIAAFAKPLQDDKTLLNAFDRALVYLTSFDRLEAPALVDEWLQYYPEDATALYFQKIFAGKAMERAPAAYVKQHFDQLAGTLDARARRTMDYRVPEKMAALFDEAAGAQWRGAVLDAGCGEGLAGAALHKFVTHLTGVDLSPRMAALARQSKLYDEVVTGDLLKGLQEKWQAYDLIVAAESLIYFGALEPIFKAAYDALRPGGWLMFDLEGNSEKTSYTLMTNGRFRHAKPYVLNLGAKAFVPVRDFDTVLRLQGERQIRGTIYLFQKGK